MAAERLPAVAARGAGFLVLWCILAGVHVADLPAAVVAVAAATWCSVRLLPPGGSGVSLLGVAQLMVRFPRQSLLAGVDVASRAFDPKCPLRPGFVRYTPLLPTGMARDAFTAFASLLPGTLPIETNPDGTILVHCLDTAAPAAEGLRTEEAAFIRAFAGRSHDV